MVGISCKLLALGRAITAHQLCPGNATFPISDQDNKISPYLCWGEVGPKDQAPVPVKTEALSSLPKQRSLHWTLMFHACVAALLRWNYWFHEQLHYRTEKDKGFFPLFFFFLYKTRFFFSIKRKCFDLILSYLLLDGNSRTDWAGWIYCTDGGCLPGSTNWQIYSGWIILDGYQYDLI